MGEVTDLDAAANKVHFKLCGDETVREIEYDQLVIALGSVTRILPEKICSGVTEHAFEVKHMSDAVAIRDRAVELLELANATDDPEEKRRLLHFVVVGGNVTGIEVVGELEVFVRGATSMYANIKPEDCQFTVIELSPEILPILPKQLIKWSTKKLEDRGIRLWTGKSVKEVHADHVITSDDTKVPCSTVIWTAGIAPNPILQQFKDLTLNAHGGVDCEPTYRVKGHENIWGSGRRAVFRDGRQADAAAGTDRDPSGQAGCRQHRGGPSRR